ncbi:DUF4226 domain-containing protein, partial [Mycobacterium simiae]
GAVLADVVTGLFGGDDQRRDEQSRRRLYEMLYGPNAIDPALLGPGPAAAPPPAPGGPGALPRATDRAATAYEQAGGAVAVADEKLAALLKQIFAAHDELRAKVTAIIGDIETHSTALASDPRLAGDPAALRAFQHYVDARLGEIQGLLDNAKVDGAKRAALLAELREEYRAGTAGAHPKDAAHGGGEGGAGGR